MPFPCNEPMIEVGFCTPTESLALSGGSSSDDSSDEESSTSLAEGGLENRMIQLIFYKVSLKTFPINAKPCIVFIKEHV